jgi:glycosyltransferase involved in cell wall biosynthesis
MRFAASARRTFSVRVAFIVTEYPKTTETFILRDIMEFRRQGCEILIFSLTHFNRMDLLHDFARSTREWARDYSYFASKDVLQACGHFLRQAPGTVGGIVASIFRGSMSDPVMLLKSLFILPKSLRIARELQLWGANHVHAAYAGHPATAAWIIKRVAGIPFSVSSHAHDLFETQALLSVKLQEAALTRTISEYNRQFIIEHVPELADRPPEVIHVGAFLSAEMTRVRLEEIEGFRVLYVGSLEYRKGVDLLLNAFARVRQAGWTLDVVGDGPERKKLEALTAKLDLADVVTFQGARMNEEVGAFMRTSSLLVVPSRIGPRNQTEGLPTVIVEAFAARLPVVATRLTGIPEIVRHEETGLLFEMEDVEGLAGALQDMANDLPRAAGWAERGRTLVEAEFNQQSNAQRLLRAIEATLPGQRP